MNYKADPPQMVAVQNNQNVQLAQELNEGRKKAASALRNPQKKKDKTRQA